MTPYLAPRSNQRPASATLQRRVQMSTSRAKTFASHSKSVRFEEDKKNFGRSVSTKDNKFHFPWKKKKEAKSTEAGFMCDSPSSIRSAPSTVGHAVSRAKRVQSPVHSVDGTDMRARSPAGSDTTDNTYDLYAICNHMGTMTRGHYTAYCRNPADGHWYMFDDNHVQSLSEEQLVTAGAYLLFYVRQSLLNQLPPLGSTSSSSSSGSSSHWAMHIPRFRLDLNSSFGSTEMPYNPEAKSSRMRCGSTTSAVSAPPVNSRGFSPLSSAHDNESDVFIQSRSGLDSHSVSLPPTTNTTPLHYHHLSSPSYHPSFNQSRGANARHASLRVSRPRQQTPDNINEMFTRRGTSFHESRQHQAAQRSLTDSGRVLEMPAHPTYPLSGHILTVPSRSIPNIMTADFPSSAKFTLPSNSIPDMPAHMSPPATRHNFASEHTFHFMTPQPHRARTYSAGHNLGQSGTESCV